MISSIRIHNFLSLRDVEVELGKLNVLIGPNASGKSNFLKALMLLRNIAVTGYPVLDERASEIPFTDIVYNHDNNSTVIMRVEIYGETGTSAYGFRLSSTGYDEIAHSSGRTVYHSESHAGRMFYVTSTGVLKQIVSAPVREIYCVTRYPYPPGGVERRSVLLRESVLRNPPADADASIHTLSGILRKIGVFRLDPVQMRFASGIMEPPTVGYRGENLARYLLHLYLESPEDFHRVEEAIKSLIPEVDRLIPHIEGQIVELWVRARGLSLPLRPEFVSDGTLRLLAITMLLYAGFSVVAIEEPENHVHPYLLEALVDLARRSPSQVVFTTHSPYLLDYVKPEEVYVVSKVGTETRIRRLTDTEEIEEVRRFLEEGGTLGEAWFARLFGE